MSIQVTTLKGNSSLSADRITINDNFKIITDATNQLLGILNTSTGKFDNTGIGADGTITTDGLTIKTGSAELEQGNLNLTQGNINLANNGSFIQFGTGNKLTHIPYTNTNVLGLEGFVGVELKQFTTLDLADLTTELSSAIHKLLVVDSDTNQLKFWNGTTWLVLQTV